MRARTFARAWIHERASSSGAPLLPGVTCYHQRLSSKTSDSVPQRRTRWSDPLEVRVRKKRNERCETFRSFPWPSKARTKSIRSLFRAKATEKVANRKDRFFQQSNKDARLTTSSIDVSATARSQLPKANYTRQRPTEHHCYRAIMRALPTLPCPRGSRRPRILLLVA